MGTNETARADALYLSVARQAGDVADAFVAAHAYLDAIDSPAEYNAPLGGLYIAAFGVALAETSYLHAIISAAEDARPDTFRDEVVENGFDFEACYLSYVLGPDVSGEPIDALRNSVEEAAHDFVATVVEWLESNTDTGL